MKFLFKTFVLIFLFSIGATIMAEEKKAIRPVENTENLDESEKYALIIGIDKFDDPNIGTLKFTVNDAEKFYETLTSTDGGFPKKNVMLMTRNATDENHRPTRNNVLAMLTSWLSLAEEGDTLLVYFSSHGLELDRETYLVPSDAKLSDPGLTTIPLSIVKKRMRNSKADKLILILDACHSGEGKATPKMGAALDSALNDAEGMVTLASCGLNQSSYEMLDDKEIERLKKAGEHERLKTYSHGAFTYFLIKALEGKADRDGDSLISASEANRYVYDETKRWAATKGLQQTPKFVAAVQGEIALVGYDWELRFKELKNERKQAEAELEKVRQAQKDRTISDVEAKQREAELDEKIRQAQRDEEEARHREKMAKRQREAAEQLRRYREEADRRRRDNERKIQAEIEQTLQEIEIASHDLNASMTPADALAKSDEIQSQIDAIRPAVLQAIGRQIASVPKPQPIEIPPKGEFEKREWYQERVDQANQQEREAQRRYDEEIAQIRSWLDPEVEARSKGYKEALGMLDREFVLNEHQVVFELGPYDAEREVFPAKIRKSGSRKSPLENLSWELAVPIDQGETLKRSVANGTVKLRVSTRLNRSSRRATIDKVRIEGGKFGYPSPRLSVKSDPRGATVSIDGRKMGTTPYNGLISPGQHKVKLEAGEAFKTVTRIVSGDFGDHSEVYVTLPLDTGFAFRRRVGMTFRSALVPGWGQFHGEKYGSGALFLAAEIGAIFALEQMHSQTTSAINEYDAAVADYQNGFSNAEAEVQSTSLNEKFDLVDQKKNQRKIALIGVGSVWALNLVHAAITGPKPPKPPKPSRLQVSTELTPDRSAIRVAMRF